MKILLWIYIVGAVANAILYIIGNYVTLKTAKTNKVFKKELTKAFKQSSYRKHLLCVLHDIVIVIGLWPLGCIFIYIIYQWAQMEQMIKDLKKIQIDSLSN